MALNDLLPNEVLARLQRHYERRVRVAEEGYVESEADEDAVTGALGQSLKGTFRVTLGNREYVITTRYRKFGGRGKGALEKSIGADGLFEIELKTIMGDPVTRKSLLFQAKKNWRGRDSRLAGQADQLARFPGASIVVDYGPNGYSAVRTEDVVGAGADRNRLPQESDRRLSEVLGNEFVQCLIGTEDLHYDWERQELISSSYGRLVRSKLPAKHRIRSTIRERHR